MNVMEEIVPVSSGRKLDTSEHAFGELRESSLLLADPAALQSRMEEDGYLYVRGFFWRADVMASRRVVVERLSRENYLEPWIDPMEGVIRQEGDTCFRPDLTENNAPLRKLLYSGRLMDFYGEYFGEAVRHFDFTWFRAITPGRGTSPHCDVVYMGRGTREKLLTAWVPIGDAPLKLGGLMILEGSHLQHERLRNYLERDVDTYCTNRGTAKEIEEGKKKWTWDGSLARNPVTLREKLGGRWLTADFEAGDLLTFTMHTVHASTDNQSGNRLRLSSDSRYQPASLPADERWIGEKPIGHGVAGKRGRIC